MGFLDGFMKGIKDNKEHREIIEDYHDLYEMDSDYRSKAFINSNSNNGWYTCPKCGKKFRKKDIDVDHILPKSKGGDDSRYNLQLLCYHCNRSKSANTLDTATDLRKRKKELRMQDKEDLKFLNRITKEKR